MLPLATSIYDEHSRLNVFLAFKAASIFIAKLQDDTRQLIEDKTRPEIPFNLRALPSVTKIKASSAPGTLSFTLLRRFDSSVKHRQLYHARVDSTGQEIYVKFTQKYSSDLHNFCAERKLAPKLLGFERLTGGWFAVAMEKVDIVEPYQIETLPGLVDEWKKDALALVNGFHRKNLVHGDLRLPNFIFTKDKPHKMMLVDFDWGEEVGKAFFPLGRITQELNVDDKLLDRQRPITVDHDNRVLKKTFAQLDKLAARMR
jgi:hypothetical protein